MDESLMNVHWRTTNPLREPELPQAKQSLFRRLMTEPFVHFALLSVAIFGWFKLAQPAEWNAEPDMRVIVVDQQQVDLLTSQFEDTWRRPPDADELGQLKEDWLNREVLVREAMALGLDGHDEIIRNRLVQKMKFLLASQARNARPEDAVLQTYLSENSERFSTPARVAVSLVYLGQSPTDTFVADIQERLAEGADHRQLGQASLLPSGFGLSVRTSVDGNFGSGFFEQVQQMPLGEWSGPVQSSFGLHLVRLDNLWEETLPPLGAIRHRVLADWQEEQTQQATQNFVDNLRSTYTVQERIEAVPSAGES